MGGGSSELRKVQDELAVVKDILEDLIEHVRAMESKISARSSEVAPSVSAQASEVAAPAHARAKKRGE